MLWPCSIPTFDEWSSISAAREWLRQAEALLGALELRPLSLEARVSGYRTRLPKLTIECLPDEILGFILDLAIYDPLRARRTSRTCLRFRIVIMNTPSIWTNFYLDSSMTAHFITITGQRSGALGLQASINSHDHYFKLPSQLNDSMTALFSYSHKWVSISVSACKDVTELIQTCFPSPNLGRVRTFDFCCDRDTSHFYQNWSMPNLRYVIIERFMPLSSSRLWRDATTLTKCKMMPTFDPEFADIISFLAATPNLEWLHMDLKNLRDSIPQSVIQLADLSKLEYLKVVICRSFPGSINRLLASISSPNLETFYLEPFFHTEHGRDEVLSDYRQVAQHIREHYPCLKSFELVLGDTRYFVRRLIDVNIFDDIIWRLPSTITKITLKLAQLRLASSQGDFHHDDSEDIPTRTMFYPNLKELNIEECSYIGDYSFYEDLSDHLRRSGVTLDTFLPSRYLYNDFVEEDEVEGLMEEARATMRNSGCWTG